MLRYISNPFAPPRTPSGMPPRPGKLPSDLTIVETGQHSIRDTLLKGDTVKINFDELQVPEGVRRLDNWGSDIGGLHSLALRWNVNHFGLSVSADDADARNDLPKRSLPMGTDGENLIITLRSEEKRNPKKHYVVIERPVAEVQVDTLKAVLPAAILKTMNPIMMGYRVYRDLVFHHYLYQQGALGVSHFAGAGGLEPFEEKWIRAAIDQHELTGKPIIVRANMIPFESASDGERVKRFNERLEGMIQEMPQVFGAAVWELNRDEDNPMSPYRFKTIMNPKYGVKENP